MRHLSEKAFKRRCRHAYHRAQALARNEDYKSDIRELQSLGWEFGTDGFPNPTLVSYQANELAHRICRRAGLKEPVLSDGLKALSVDQIADYTRRQIFVDIPGWERVAKNPKAYREAVMSLPPSAAQRLRRTRAVDERTMTQRLRDVENLANVWEVFDRRQAGRIEREVINCLWPDVRRTAANSAEKDPIRQRVYDYEDRARRLIRGAYRIPPALLRKLLELAGFSVDRHNAYEWKLSKPGPRKVITVPRAGDLVAPRTLDKALGLAEINNARYFELLSRAKQEEPWWGFSGPS